MAKNSHDNESIPQPQDGFFEEKIDTELVLYHSETAQVIYLNSTAALVWRLCDGTRSIGEIIEVIEGAYPDSLSISTDIQGTLEQFRNFGALILP